MLASICADGTFVPKKETSERRSSPSKRLTAWVVGRAALIVFMVLVLAGLTCGGFAYVAHQDANDRSTERAWLTFGRVRMDATAAAQKLDLSLESNASIPESLGKYHETRKSLVSRLNTLASAHQELVTPTKTLTDVMASVPVAPTSATRPLLSIASANLISKLSLVGESSMLDGDLRALDTTTLERTRLFLADRLVANASVPSGKERSNVYAATLVNKKGAEWTFGAAFAGSPQPEFVRPTIASVSMSPDAQLIQSATIWALGQLGAANNTTPRPTDTDAVNAAVGRLSGQLTSIGDKIYSTQSAELTAIENSNESDASRATWMAGIAFLAAALLMVFRVRNSRISDDELRVAASTDKLTGLGNRVHLDAAVAELTERSPEVVLLHIDLDHFKPVNDTYGHAVGDRVLQMTADRLKIVATETQGVAARLGGDEFVLVLPSLSQTEIDRISRILLDELLGFTIGSLDLTVGASIGVARGSGEVTDLLINADLALYQAKRTGRGQASTFRAEAAAFVSFVRDALMDGRVEVVYQPQIALKSGRCVGVEVLARLKDESGTLIPAKDWLGIAEWLGVTGELFEHVVTAVEANLSSMPPLRTQLWFNVAPNDLIRPGGTDWVLKELGRLKLPMHSLGIELTETEAITDPARLADVIQRLRDAGIGIALDDFGARNTPIGHLVDLPVTRVKLDRSLIAGIRDDMPPSSWVVKAMAELAGRLKIEVMAEGVTSGAQVGLLTRLGVPAAQGYLLGLPGPLSRIPAGVDVASLLQSSMSGIETGPSVGPLVRMGDSPATS